MVKLNIGRAFGLGPSLLLLACTATVATGCLKNKMAAAQAIRTGSGDNARSLNAVGVATESGSPGFCLYSVKGQLNPVAAAPASGEPAALSAPGTEIVTPQALLDGELLQALETIPGIDNIRTAAINDLVTPVALALGAGSAAAGRFLPAVSKVQAKLQVKLTASYAKLIENTKASLQAKGFQFPANSGAAKQFDELRNGRITFDEFLKYVRSTLNTSSVGEGYARNIEQIVERASRNHARLTTFQAKLQGQTLAATAEGAETAAREVAQQLTLDLGQASPSAGVAGAEGNAAASAADNATTQGARASRRWLTLAPWEEACGKGATGTRLVMKASLCAIGAAVATGGTLWGIGTLATGAGSMKINTDQVKAALAAQADNSADVVVDGASYERLVTGLKNFSRQILSNPAQASRPPCN